jgi:hypothetical protein
MCRFVSLNIRGLFYQAEIIYIPKEFHKQAEKLEGKQVKILVDDVI